MNGCRKERVCASISQTLMDIMIDFLETGIKEDSLEGQKKYKFYISEFFVLIKGRKHFP